MAVRSEHIHVTGCIGRSGLGFDLVLNAEFVDEVRTSAEGCSERVLGDRTVILSDLYFLGAPIERLLQHLVVATDWDAVLTPLLNKFDETYANVDRKREDGAIVQFTVNPDLECNSGDAICFRDRRTGEWICIE